ncbi:DHS-like NAD/FAD-binding domain-containing protein [Sordaria brevicollis]|uniref:DHS-like NAD/FAD-binding domain-containing protein n=1 Tax=Sordaria brevicollis TaxID=83679 RepID=A0AAE0UFE6_SORBR|nr:DHS-like NAD/FAD-binding domain-containing protein [Sordaria brevicollis]
MDPSRRGVVNGAGAAASGSSSSSGHKSGSGTSKHGGSSAYQSNTGNNTKRSSKMKEVANYDDKKHNVLVPDLEEDIAHPVAHRQLNELEEHVNDLHESWETESIFEEILEDITEDRPITDEVQTDGFEISFQLRELKKNMDAALKRYKKIAFGSGGKSEDPEACTPEEAVEYRRLLRLVGPKVFVQRTVDAGVISIKKLLTAFGIRPPAFLEGAGDDAYYSLLMLAMTREIQKRAKLMKYNTIDDAVELLKRSKNIIVLTGAGISTSLGIPDFRSKGTGLYSKLEHLGLSDPQEVFDINIFRQDPNIFYSVARDILPNTERFSPTHAFIALLQQKGKLLTNYSQNIDNLEAKAGISPDKLVQCHGSFATATCVKCGYKVPGESIFPEIKAGRIPRCRKCAQGNRTTNNSLRKRKLARDGTEKKPRRVKPGEYDSNSDSEFDHGGLNGGNFSSDHYSSEHGSNTMGCGVMKPDITFFGEALPDEFSTRLTEHDRDLVDLVIVIGTSLKVAPVSEVVPFLPPHIPQIYISRTPVSHVNFDIDLLGDCDVVVSELCKRAGWDLKHEMIPEGQVIRTELAEGYNSRHVFTQIKPEPKPTVMAEINSHHHTPKEVAKEQREANREERRRKREEREREMREQEDMKAAAERVKKLERKQEKERKRELKEMALKEGKGVVNEGKKEGSKLKDGKGKGPMDQKEKEQKKKEVRSSGVSTSSD